MTARGKDAKIKRGDFFLYTVYNQFSRGGGGAAIYNTRISFNVAIITEKNTTWSFVFFCNVFKQFNHLTNEQNTVIVHAIFDKKTFFFF